MGHEQKVVPVSTALLAAHPEQVALNKATSSFSSVPPPTVEAAGAAAAGRTAAAVESAFPSPCLHPPFPTLDQVSPTVSQWTVPTGCSLSYCCDTRAFCRAWNKICTTLTETSGSCSSERHFRGFSLPGQADLKNLAFIWHEISTTHIRWKLLSFFCFFFDPIKAADCLI